MRNFFTAIALICSVCSPLAEAACPDLSAFYSESPHSSLASPDWERARVELSGYFDQCLLSSEYFALFGAAQLNSGYLPEAMESLERAILLDPDNGAAMIDYADALLRDGQLFAAIEANAMLLERDDLPSALMPQLDQRQRNWGTLVQQTSWQLDLLAGYDDNLNGAPDEDLITLTLSGEPILLTLNEEFRAVRGPFLNSRLIARHRRLAPDYQHSFMGQIRGRLSEDTASDVLQLAGRYSRLFGVGPSSSQWGGGLNHLMFAGKPLFTGTDARYRVQFGGGFACRHYVGGAMQHQIWHERRNLDGLEVEAGFGTSCSLAGSSAQRISLEASLLHNAGFDDARLGGNRDGWQLAAGWQIALPRGLFSAQINHSRLLDGRGYSALLEDNARRAVSRSSVLLQYRETVNWLLNGTQLQINLYHQDQQSNLDLFKTEDTSLEIGLSLRF